MTAFPLVYYWYTMFLMHSQCKCCQTLSWCGLLSNCYWLNNLLISEHVTQLISFDLCFDVPFTVEYGNQLTKFGRHLTTLLA